MPEAPTGGISTAARPLGVCQSCFARAPVQQVLFVQHVGALVMYFHKRIGGKFCRNCVNKYFRQFGLVTLFFGWWGLLSMIATPFVLLIDTFNYFRAWSLPPVPAGTASLTPDVIARLEPMAQGMLRHLQEGASLEKVTSEVAGFAKCTEAQVVLYLTVIMEQAGKSAAEHTA